MTYDLSRWTGAESFEHEVRVVQPAHQQTQMEVQQVRERAAICYREAGDPRSVPILFLHGIGGAARSFAPQLAYFGRHYRALAWELGINLTGMVFKSGQVVYDDRTINRMCS